MVCCCRNEWGASAVVPQHWALAGEASQVCPGVGVADSVAMAATLPGANGPPLVGASGPVTMAVACRRARGNRTVSLI